MNPDFSQSRPQIEQQVGTVLMVGGTKFPDNFRSLKDYYIIIILMELNNLRNSFVLLKSFN
jgi:hypothetical protein